VSSLKRVPRQGGFTLLEAVVAMTIFATSALGLYAWINSMMIGTARFDEIVIETTDVNNAVDFLSLVNPMEQPDGEQQLGALTVRWQSELVEPVRPGNMVSTFEFGLYRLDVSLERTGAQPKALELIQVGYRALAEEGERIGI
jgi:general secretion pathway protein I